MKSTETMKASNASNTLDMYSKLNKTSNSVPTKKGQKLQSTVRFESDTYSQVEQIKDNLGVSFAEAVRKLVERGLDNLNQKRGGLP